MKAQMTSQEMEPLIAANLYHLAGEYNELLVPNYRYCRNDAPVYEETEPDSNIWRMRSGALIAERTNDGSLS